MTLLRSLISLINAEDTETLINFTKLLIKEISMLNNTKIAIIDFKKYIIKHLILLILFI